MIDEAIRNLTESIKAKKKSKTLIPTEAELLISETLEVYEEKNDPSYYYSIAELHKRISKESALKFLESKLSLNETYRGNDYLNLFVIQSDLYFAVGDLENSFVALRTASKCLADTKDENIGSNLYWSNSIYSKSAQICFEKKEFSDYLHYAIIAFVVDTAQHFCNYISFNSFFKEEERTIRLNNFDFEFSESLEVLGFLDVKNDLLSDLQNFTYQELPLKYGIPARYLENPFIESIEDWDENRDEIRSLMNLLNQLAVKGYSFILNEASIFSKSILKKYLIC